MRVTSITVSARRTFNHPHERFANFQFGIEVSAALEPGDNPREIRACLLRDAENAAEAHKAAILREVRDGLLREALEQEIQLHEGVESKIAELRALQSRVDAVPAESHPDQQRESQRIAAELVIQERRAVRIAEARAELAAIPAPELLPAPELHPGHPRHPDTDDDFDPPY